ANLDAAAIERASGRKFYREAGRNQQRAQPHLLHRRSRGGRSSLLLVCADRPVTVKQWRPQFNADEQFSARQTITTRYQQPNQIAASLPLDQINCSQTGEE